MTTQLALDSWVKVESATVMAVSSNPEAQTLQVAFQNGRTYGYLGV